MSTEHLVNSFFTALRFLTIIPLSHLAEKDDEYFSESVNYFVIVGLLIGYGGYCTVHITSTFLPHGVTSVVLIFYLAVISGFLHLDGLADTADGFFSSRPKKQILDIMRDSRIGAMGVICIVFIILLKYSSFNALSSEELAHAAFFVPVVGRISLVISMLMMPNARDNGLGKLFTPQSKTKLFLFTAASVLCASLFLSFSHMVLMLSVAISTSFLFGMWCKIKIGGATGDTFGATCEISETLAAISLSFFYN